MLESAFVSHKVKVGSSFINYNDIRLKIKHWIESDKATKLVNSQQNCSNRKRFHSSILDKKKQLNQNLNKNWKRRREHYNKSNGSASLNSLNSNLKADNQRRQIDLTTMTRSSCEIRRQHHNFLDLDRNSHIDSHSRPNGSLSQLHGFCSTHYQDHSQVPVRSQNNGPGRIHLPALHQMSATSQQQFIPAKEALISNTVSNQFNTQVGRTNKSCNSVNICALTNGLQNNACVSQCRQHIRRRHRTCDQLQSYQSNISTSGQYTPSRTVNNVYSQSAVAACSIPNRTPSQNSISLSYVSRSFGQNSNQLRFTTFPLTAYTTQQPPIFSRRSLPTNNIHTHTSAFCSAVQLPTIIGDVFTSAPCNHCAIIASSGLNAFSNLSSMLQFSVSTSTASLITLGTVPGDRVNGSRLSYVPVQTVNHWHNHHPYLPAAWSYNDLTSILHNPAARNLVQDQLVQNIIPNSANVGVQLVMLAPSSVVGSTNDHSQIRHHLYPLPQTDSISPVTVSRYLPTLDHLPLIDNPKPGITRQELDTIPTRKFVKSSDKDTDYKMPNDDKDRCMICIEDFMPDEVIRMLRCSHDFHSSCVEKWLKINRTCPLCRSDACPMENNKSGN